MLQDKNELIYHKMNKFNNVLYILYIKTIKFNFYPYIA